jgi:hypothetical protein
LNTAIFQPNVNVGYWTQQAAKAQAAAMYSQPLMHVENQHINSNVDLQQQLAKAQFLQSVSGSL